jgi:predicted transcriptional regulator
MSNKIISFIEDNSKEIKPEKNQKQSVNKLGTNRAQTVHKPNTKRTQNVHKPNTNRTQTINKSYTEPYTKLYTKLSLSALSGLQREILIFLFHECKKQRSEITPELTLQFISNSLNIRLMSVKTTLARLVEKGFISRAEHKAGRGGWSKFRFPEELYKEFFQLETEQKLYTKQYTEPYTTSPSSSININNNINTTTTETENLKISIPEGWEDLDFSQINGFTWQTLHSLMPYIKQYGFSEFDIQQSIYSLVYDDETGIFAARNRKAVLISKIKEGDLYTSDTYQKFALGKAAKAKKNTEEIIKANVLAWIDEVGRDYIEKKLPPNLILDFKIGGQAGMNAVTDLYMQELKRGCK